MQVSSSSLKRAFVAALLLAAPSLSSAQSTQQRLDSAIALYKAFSVEQARGILSEITSPGYLQPISSQQKAQAYKYLGAAAAVLVSADSAKRYFIAALDFDPFTDLDPSEFAEAEIGAFALAKASIPKVGIRAVETHLIVPQSQADSAAYVFRLITTQRSNLVVDLMLQNDTTMKENLYTGPNEGARALPWRGQLQGGVVRFAPNGLYIVRAVSTSPGNQPMVETMPFRIEQIIEPLEDPLPELDTLRQLLPERIRTSAPWFDLIKGVTVAAAGIALPMFALDPGQISWQTHAAAASAAGLIGGLTSWYYRRKNPQIPQNVDENALRRRERQAFNDGVKERNDARISRTRLVISPVGSFGQ